MGPAHFYATKQTTTIVPCKTQNLTHAKFGPSKSYQNPNTANQTKQLTITEACVSTSMETPCAAAFELALQLGTFATKP